MVYDLFAYGKMIADTVRMEAYESALRRLIDPHKIVLDIGTGTGVMALLACHYGAKKVYAVEPGDAVHLAKEIAAANGWSDKIVFYQQRSTDLVLPKPADIIVSDLRGVLPVFQHHLPSIIDARDRLLGETGTLIPQCDNLYVSIVAAPRLVEAYHHPWTDSPYGINMQPAADCLIHLWRKANFRKEDLLCRPALWTTLDYRTIDRPDVQGSVELVIDGETTAHGFAMWFDTDLFEDAGFSTAPGSNDTVYGQAFFPWPEPMALAAGDAVTISLKAIYAGLETIWWWHTRIYHLGDIHRLKAEFRQSTFFAKPLGLQNLHKRQSSSTPELRDSGRIDLFILQQMDGRKTLEEIAQRTQKRFPDYFHSVTDALRRVADMSERYSRDGMDRL